MDLKPIDRTDRGKERIYAALSIYREEILPEAQNPERQILYLIDHSRDNLSDEFRCFSIHNGRDVIGYLQYSYFREEHIFFFEYLCIRDSVRQGLIPSYAIKSIEYFLAQTYQPGFTIVFEVAHTRIYNGEWESNYKLISYFKRLGFRKVEFNCEYPILQSYNGQTSYPADLMVYLPERRAIITQSEMRTILRCIYFKHYLRWDRPFLDSEQFSKRERLINELYSKEVAKISGEEIFKTNGDKRRKLAPLFSIKGNHIKNLMVNIFSPRLPRISSIIIILMIVQWIIGNSLLLIPFVISVALVYCLAEDTEASRKLLLAIISRLSSVRPPK